MLRGGACGPARKRVGPARAFHMLHTRVANVTSTVRTDQLYHHGRVMFPPFVRPRTTHGAHAPAALYVPVALPAS